MVRGCVLRVCVCGGLCRDPSVIRYPTYTCFVSVLPMVLITWISALNRL